EVDRAATKAATAFATHISEPPRADDPLAAALDSLDVAHDRLRAAAELPASDKVGKPLVAAGVLEISDAGAPVEDLDVDGAVPSAHGRVLFGRTASRQIQVDLIVGGKP